MITPNAVFFIAKTLFGYRLIGPVTTGLKDYCRQQAQEKSELVSITDIDSMLCVDWLSGLIPACLKTSLYL